MAQYEKYAITAQRLTGIADAIREKNGSSDTYAPSEMADAILAIEAGGGNASTFIVSARAYFPNIRKAQVNNVLTIPVTTSAIGGIKNDS